MRFLLIASTCLALAACADEQTAPHQVAQDKGPAQHHHFGAATTGSLMADDGDGDSGSGSQVDHVGSIRGNAIGGNTMGH
ncbi:hypothetical protein [Gluconacetobacter takamatsuzukensis]|uniref:Lipoprotein n=1 Tax=Gluconacetobacter takamatsuzukensis TaxID=1286190 RepID=A0A7W4PPI8_9PROT|nr:hypothetical protein [Gluconacetobacter takamatsuzukensis]MBB2205672.1 hypothetical protein [Gluconacetobacter takamatsuzukensis]